MTWFVKALWFAGGWAVGSVVVSICVSTIIITLNCSMRIWKILKNCTDCWNPKACKKYLWRLVFTHLFISICVSALIVWLCPKFAIAGYCFGIVLTLLLGIGGMGMNENNISDTLRIFRRYAYPGKEDSIDKLLIVKSYMRNL